MKNKRLSLLLILFSFSAFSQKLPLLKITDDKQYIETETKKPFFWLGDTAWELIHRLEKEEIDRYLTNRAEKGFTVIQTVVLAELDGLNEPNAYGEKPLIKNDPTQINEKYFELVDYVLNKANELGLYVALLPTWGDKFNLKWGVGPEIFNEQNAEIYGEILAKRYVNHNNLIWILGGDRLPETDGHFSIVRAMAKGIRKADSRHLISYHPAGSKKATDFFTDSWLDLDMYQSGHSRLATEYKYVLESKASELKRPIINGEARYENILDRFWENKYYGWLDDADVRISAYWSVLAGAAGYTYGCNDIWQMYDSSRKPMLKARTDWFAALDLPGSMQMKYMKELFEALPWQEIRADQSLITSENPKGQKYALSALGQNRDFALAYTPVGTALEIDLSKMKAKKVKAFWFNPRSGRMLYSGTHETKAIREFNPWSDGWGSDFLLVLVNEKMSIDFDHFLK